MADAPDLIYNDRPGALPATYRFPPGLDARLSSVSAVFDGTGAGADFLACLSVYSQDGKLIGRFFPGSAVAAGDVAEVTFAPFLSGDAASGEGGGLQFNSGTYGPNNFGDWLKVTVDGSAPGGFGMEFVSTGGGGLNFTTDDDGPLELKANGDGGIEIESNGDGDLIFRQTGDAPLLIEQAGEADLEVLQNAFSFLLKLRASGDILVDLFGGGYLIVDDLDTSDPGVPNALWNSGGFVAVSP